MSNSYGIFTISLDFELYWGMKDVVSVDGYKTNLDGTPKAVELMLDLFLRYDIHATWATVGFLFCKDVDELKSYYPKKVPKYRDKEIDLYNYLEQNILKDSYHFAPKSVELIKSYPNQEIATHTFSHYYTLEDGQNEEVFYEDLLSAKRVAEDRGIKLSSIVFPRNQYKSSYLEILNRVGILSYRGNENGWIYEAESEREKKRVSKRLLRIIDSYINISTHHTYRLEELSKNRPYNIPASRFLRPYSKRVSFLDPLKLKRIKDSMSYAAKNNQLYHLWWHPHNFGSYTEENIKFLTKILEHYRFLENRYGFKSMNMREISGIL